MQYIKITTTNNYSNKKEYAVIIEDKFHNKKHISINLPYPLEIINGESDELIIPIHEYGLINEAYIKRKVFKEETAKEEIIKEYLEIPSVLLFFGKNYIKIK